MNTTNITMKETVHSTNSHQTKVLVVADDLRLRDLLRRYLAEQGFNVVTAENAQAMNKLRLRERLQCSRPRARQRLVKQAARRRCEIVLGSARLPDGSGRRAYRRVLHRADEPGTVAGPGQRVPGGARARGRRCGCARGCAFDSGGCARWGATGGHPAAV